MQFVNINAVPLNIYPDDIANASQQYWIKAVQPYITPIAGHTYSISGTSSIGTYTIFDTLPTNTIYWQQGDNRSQLMKLHYMEMVLFYLNKTITPTNIPEIRVKGYKMALDYLEALGTGKKNSPILQLQPAQGNPIRFGGQVRKNQTW
jgi:hypothetical protein